MKISSISKRFEIPRTLTSTINSAEVRLHVYSTVRKGICFRAQVKRKICGTWLWIFYFKKSRESQKKNNNIHEQQKRYYSWWLLSSVMCFMFSLWSLQSTEIAATIRINRNGVCCKTVTEFLRILFVNVRLQKFSRRELYLQNRQLKEHSLNATDPAVYDLQVLHFAWCGKTDTVRIALTIHIKTPVFKAVPGYDRSSVVNRHTAVAWFRFLTHLHKIEDQ